MWHISKCNTEKSYKCIWCLRCFIYASQSITPKHHSFFTFYFSLTKYLYYKCFIFQSTEVYSFEKIHSTTRKKKLQNVPIITIFSPFFLKPGGLILSIAAVQSAMTHIYSTTGCNLQWQWQILTFHKRPPLQPMPL